jgi:hypothetical protein
MKKKLSSILLLILLVLFSGCHRMATTPTVDLSRFTPQPSQTAVEGIPAPETISTFSLDPETERALQLFPLWVGSSWVYEYLGYDENVEIIWRVVETVVETDVVEGHYVAKLEREAEVIEGVPPEGFEYAPDTGTVWFLIAGKNIYRFDDQLHTDLSKAWLDLILPFPEAGDAWYPDPDQRASDKPDLIGSRYASEPFEGKLPMGGMYTCYNVAMHYDDRTEEGTFCENVGFVYKELNIYDFPYGYRSELVGFSLQGSEAGEN